MTSDLVYKLVPPDQSLAGFVDSFWMLQNQSDEEKKVTGLPDGRIDLFFSRTDTGPFQVTLIGLGTQYDQAVIAARHKMFAISFRLPAVENIFRFPIATLLNKAMNLPPDFWGFHAGDLNDFGTFCEKAAQTVRSLLPQAIDERKRQLFELIYAAKGEISVGEVSGKTYWSSRQINRYFNQQFGLSLKAYCNILRFRASLEHIARGKLFPELDFADQNHFIKEIKKFSGVVPKDLSQNRNDRFILLSAIKQG